MNYKIKLRQLLEKAVQKKASDLHISVGHPPVLRIVRDLVDIDGESVVTPSESQNLAFALLTPEQKEKFLRNKEIDFAYDLGNKIRFRVNVFLQSGKISIAFRLISSKIRTIEELKLPLVLRRFTESYQGLVLVTGASSQGKSTTLAAIIDEINKKRKEHIITIEDPIEYVFEDEKSIIDQREVHTDTNSFQKALRSTLREDPDVIMVGEMRDLETIATTITAAETGHLVFATLHTNSTSQTIHRAIDVFPPHQQSQIRAQLAGSLLGVVSQRLLPSITENDFVPACEVMFTNSAIRNLMRENKIHEIPSVIETSADEGMILLNKSLTDLVKKKEIKEGTALSYSLSPEDLKSRLHRF